MINRTYNYKYIQNDVCRSYHSPSHPQQLTFVLLAFKQINLFCFEMLQFCCATGLNLVFVCSHLLPFPLARSLALVSHVCLLLLAVWWPKFQLMLGTSNKSSDHVDEFHAPIQIHSPSENELRTRFGSNSLINKNYYDRVALICYSNIKFLY